MFSSPRPAIAFLAIGLLAGPCLRAEQDVPPVDINQLLKDLHGLKEKQTVQFKSMKQAAIQQVNAAAGSTERGLALWEEAIRGTQMDGAGKENAQFRVWRDTEGELYKEREVQSAVHLHLEWLALTLQRSNGATVKEMLPTVINYTKELLGDQAMMEALEDMIKKDKDQPAGMKPRTPRSRADSSEAGDVATKKTHDSILNKGLGGSVVVQWLRLGDFVAVEKWEQNPGNFDGIYKNIIQPELRSQKDAHVFDYWDFKLNKERDQATKSKLTFEIEQYNTRRRPALLWDRAQEYVFLGQKNRAITEMFNLIKTYPTHPDAEEWIAALELLVSPTPPPDTSAGAAAPGATVAPPAAATRPAP